MARIRPVVKNLLSTILVFFMLVSASGASAASQPQASAQPQAAAPANLQQFRAGGHILGVLPTGVYVASTRHALHIDFVGANSVQPQSAGTPTGQSLSGKEGASPDAAPLQKVTWTNLWQGITLAYQADDSGGGIAESVYTLAPGADVSAIRLRYNVPAALESGGSLALTFNDGQMTESAPAAWQEINGQRVPVEVGFSLMPVSQLDGSGKSEVGFRLGTYNPAYTLTIDPRLEWLSHLGGYSHDTDLGRGVAVDGGGNVYVVGDSELPWGTNPLRDFTKGSAPAYSDAFVVKLNPDGAMQWYTFLGGTGDDSGYGIGLDSGGSIYVAGYCTNTWGVNIVQPYQNGGDGYVVKLNTLGNIVWTTFIGSSNADNAVSLAVNASGLYIAGNSADTWGSPVSAHAGGAEAYAARLNPTSGVVMWNTFMGSSGFDKAYAIAIDAAGNSTVVGTSDATWGSPLHGFTIGRDTFVVRLNNLGGRQWLNFLGGAGNDDGTGVAMDGSSNAYVAGTSDAAWGTTPVRAYSGWYDGYAAKINSSGGIVWTTFLGATTADEATTIGVSNGYVIVGGDSQNTWGNPNHGLTGAYDLFAAQLNATSGELGWNTFWGGNSLDSVSGIAFDPSGDMSLTGSSYDSWGTPVRQYAAYRDATALKLTASGILLWNTFMGCEQDDFVLDIAIDFGGHLYVTGYSNNTWGSPVSWYQWKNDAFVARMDANTGAIVWSTFLGGDENDYGYGISVDGGGSGRVYVVGKSYATWGTPTRAFTNTTGGDGFIAVLNESNGSLAWSTFMGGAGADGLNAVVTDNTGNVYAAGLSNATWGSSPTRAYTGGNDAMAVKVNSSGVLVWNTFLGGTGHDSANGLIVDFAANNLYVVGSSGATWGSAPVRAYTASTDGFAAHLTPSTGAVTWNAFLGGLGADDAVAVSMDSFGTIFVAGNSSATWGSPLRGYSSSEDAYLARLDIGGLFWMTFLGGPGLDYATDLAADQAANVYITGTSSQSWGAPVSSFSGGGDAFVVRVDPQGGLTWNTFQGGPDADYSTGIAVDANGIYAAGYSYTPWGGIHWDPAGWDGFVTRNSLKNFKFLPTVRK